MYSTTSDTHSFSVQLTEKQLMTLLKINSVKDLKRYLEIIDEPRCPGTYGLYLIKPIALVKEILEGGTPACEIKSLYAEYRMIGLRNKLQSEGIDANKFLIDVENDATNFALRYTTPGYSYNLDRLNNFLWVVLGLVVTVMVFNYFFNSPSTTNESDRNYNENKEVIIH